MNVVLAAVDSLDGRNLGPELKGGQIDARLDCAPHLRPTQIYAKRQKVEVKLADGTSRTLGIDDKFTLPDLLPGWELPVAKLFE